MSPLKCYLRLFAAAFLVLAASSNDFQPGSVSTEYRRPRRLYVKVNYTATARPNVELTATYKGETARKLPRHRFRDNVGEVRFSIPGNLGLSPNITFAFPEFNFTILFHPLPLNPARGAPSIDRTEAVPNVRFRPEGDIVYAESGDVIYGMAVSAGVAGREDVSEEKLTYTAYVRDGSVFHVHEDWPVTVVETVALDSGAEYRLEFNTSQQRPEGVLLLKALKVYREGRSLKLVRAVEVVRRVDFYQQGHREPVPDDDSTLAFLRQPTDTHGRSTQLCDMTDGQQCRVFCPVVSGGSPVVTIRETWGWMSKLPNASASPKVMDFLSVTSAPARDVSDNGETLFQCQAVLGDKEVEEVIVLKARARPQIVKEGSSAVLHPNQTLEVRCIAKGLPAPTITLTEPGNDTPLEERFPSQSFHRTLEFNRDVRVQYWLDHPSFTSALSHVRCSAGNGFLDPDVVLLEVVAA